MIADLKIRTFSTPNALAAFVAGGGIPAIIQTTGNVFPMTTIGDKTLVLKISVDGGATYGITRTHTFTTDVLDDEDAVVSTVGDSLAALLADIQADAVFMSGLDVYAVDDEIFIRTQVAGNRALKIDASSSGIGVNLLQFLSGQISNGAITTLVQIFQDNNGQYVLFFR